MVERWICPLQMQQVKSPCQPTQERLPWSIQQLLSLVIVKAVASLILLGMEQAQIVPKEVDQLPPPAQPLIRCPGKKLAVRILMTTMRILKLDPRTPAIQNQRRIHAERQK